MVLAVSRVAVVQRRQVLARSSNDGAQRERRQTLLLGGLGVAELGVARGQAGAVHRVGLLMHFSASTASP